VGRPAALLALTVAVSAWSLLAPRLQPIGKWPDIALVGLVLMPAMLGLTWIALPLWNNRRLAPIAAAGVACAVALTALGPGLAANVAKVAAMTLCGWLFLSLFEELTWVVTVALIVPWVDAYSVWRGPTKVITSHGHAALFGALSISFLAPGGGVAGLGLPDVMFFALFLGATVRFGLRPGLTWLAMCAMLAATIALTTVWAVNSGLPALPGIAIGFLLPNIDLIWHQVARRRHSVIRLSDG